MRKFLLVPSCCWLVASFAWITSADAFVLPSSRSSLHAKVQPQDMIFTDATRLPTQIKLSPQDLIETGVSLDTFAPQFLWLPMIAAPASKWTKTIMGTYGIAAIVALALVHLTIVITAAAQEGSVDQILIFTEVFDPSLSQLGGMQKLFQYPNFVAEEWPHVLIWDLFVGRAIWLEGLKRGVDTRLSLAFCNFIGPPGLLIFVATCLLSGKGLPSMGLPDEFIEEDDN